MSFQPAKKNEIGSCSVRRRSIVVLMFFLCFLFFRVEISNFRVGTLRFLLSQILNFTTSDTPPGWGVIPLHHQFVAECAE